MFLIKFWSVILSQCLLILLVVNCTPHPDELSFYINDENGFICVADGDIFDSAIDFIYPIKNDTKIVPKIQTYLEPALVNSSIECDITKGKACNEYWSIDNWKIETHSPLNFVSILDSRWEKFNTILTTNNTPSDKVILPSSNCINITLSIRATNNAEILLCQGWDPKKYPCNGLEINEKEHSLIFKKYDNGLLNGDTLIKKININQSFVISPNEWRTYTLQIANNKSLTLIDSIDKNFIFNHSEENSLKAVYLFARSVQPALWKIHKNDFLYTKNVGTSKFGNLIEFTRSNFCIAFRTVMCQDCKLIIFKNVTGTQEVIANITSNNENEWKFNKIFIKSMNATKMQFYVRTEAINSTKMENSFWAIDDIRECTRKEVKIYRLNEKMLVNTKVSCQCLKHPHLRPEMQTLPKFKDLPKLEFESTSTSIDISWKDNSDIAKIHPHYYAVSYKGKAQCTNESEKDIRRTQSFGYEIIINTNNVTFDGLVPFTHYSVTFKDVLYDKVLTNLTNTKPLDEPTVANLPHNMKYQITNVTATLEWDSPKCYETFGSIVYTVKVLGEDTNYTKTVYQSKFYMESLKPYTNYTVIIATKVHMTSKDTTSIDKTFNFTTLSGISPRLENVEVYVTDINFVKIRYNLPKITNGLPINVLTKYCHPLLENGCKSLIFPIEKCQLWKDKYCLLVNKLFLHYNYTIGVSLKNLNTSTYGESVEVHAFTTSTVPSKPTHLTASTINCMNVSNDCHLLINWTYPYYPNAKINRFVIDVRIEELIGNNVNKVEDIYNSVPVTEDSISTFSYVVLHVPYSGTYNVTIKSCNLQFCSQPDQITLTNNHLPNVSDQSPKLIVINENSLTFQLPKVDEELTSSSLYVIVQDYNNINATSIKPINMSEGLDYSLCNSYGNTWITAQIHLNASMSNLTIGDNKMYETYLNKPLKDDTNYCLTFLFVNQYNTSKYLTVYHEENLKTKRMVVVESSSRSYIVVLVLLLIFLPLGWLGYKYFKKGQFRLRFRRGNNEPAYEYIRTDLISNDVYESS